MASRGAHYNASALGQEQHSGKAGALEEHLCTRACMLRMTRYIFNVDIFR